jgi:hypothetical protein
MRRHEDFAYEGLIGIFSPPILLARLTTRMGPYILMWLFFAAVGVIAAATGESDAPTIRECRIALWGSLAGGVLLQVASVYPFSRYCYPVIWAGVLGLLLTVELKNRVLTCVLVALQMVQAAPLFTRSIDRFALWPSLVTDELIDSGGTIFVGLPIYGMTTWQLVRNKTPCVWINSENGEQNEHIQQFVTSTFPRSPIVMSRSFQDSGSSGCSPANTVRFWREHVTDPGVGCAATCGSCTFQRVEYYSNVSGWVRNQMCWPRR